MTFKASDKNKRYVQNGFRFATEKHLCPSKLCLFAAKILNTFIEILNIRDTIKVL